MKSFNLIFQILVLSLISIIIIFWGTAYKSAFEADQYCHSQLSFFNKQSDSYGCDHDIETHQWILYEKQQDPSPSKVVKRFRYRFL